jgi:signal recognition particle GTPase
MFLEEIEKANPSVLRVSSEKTIRQLYEYENDNSDLNILNIESEFTNALDFWGNGCLSTHQKRLSLKKKIKKVLLAIENEEIEKRDQESLERIYELLITINVINETVNYLCEVKGQEILNSMVNQVYDLKKVIEWKRRMLEGLPVNPKNDIMTEEEKNADTPAQVMAVLKKRIQTVNVKMLTEKGRNEIIAQYSEVCEKEGFTRHMILFCGLAESAEMLNQLFEMCSPFKG